MRTETLQQILHDAYGLGGGTLSAIEGGYTNSSYALEHDAGSFVLRCGWPGKSPVQARQEERVLAWLARAPGPLSVPRIIPTAAGELHLRHENRTLHLFSRVPGQALYHWSDTCSEAHLEAAMAVLAQLHHSLQCLDTGDVPTQIDDLAEELDALEELETLASISATPATRALLDRHLPAFLTKARVIIDEARTREASTSNRQWCHGDYQLENFLFENDALVGLVDFDRLHIRSPEMDLAFALFNLTRDGAWEEGFRWNRTRWQRGARSYGGAMGDSLAARDWSELFCVDQALQHLRAGLDGVWELDRGIGFLPSFRGVLQS